MVRSIKNGSTDAKRQTWSNQMVCIIHSKNTKMFFPSKEVLHVFPRYFKTHTIIPLPQECTSFKSSVIFRKCTMKSGDTLVSFDAQSNSRVFCHSLAWRCRTVVNSNKVPGEWRQFVFTFFGALFTVIILLMEEILHHLGCKKLVNNGRNYPSTGAGFLPSTVVRIVA